MISEDQGEKNNGEAPPMPTINGLDAPMAIVRTGVYLLASTVLHRAAKPDALCMMRLDYMYTRVETRLPPGNRDGTCRRASILGAVMAKTIVFKSDNCATRG